MGSNLARPGAAATLGRPGPVGCDAERPHPDGFAAGGAGRPAISRRLPRMGRLDLTVGRPVGQPGWRVGSPAQTRDGVWRGARLDRRSLWRPGPGFRAAVVVSGAGRLAGAYPA